MDAPIHVKTLRDEFAMAALMGLLASDAFVEKANEQSGGNGAIRRDLLTQEAFRFANAELIQRNQ